MPTAPEPRELERPGRREHADGPPPADLPDAAFVVALASLPAAGPARLHALCALGDPRVAWRRLRDGSARHELREVVSGPDADACVDAWIDRARRLDVAELWQRHLDAGIGVVTAGSPAYPGAFEDDPEPPAILFHVGDPDVLVGPRVTVIGTRDCTHEGHELAFELGFDLASAGVRVVSGLALGIDGAAHAGAIEAAATPPVAVVGSGLDVVYPRRNGPLWRAVARDGVVLSEYPLGTKPHAWRFPARNRLLAALGDVVVVVESHETGGAMLTVDEALRRGRDVMAVPGSVRSPAARGTNRLLAEAGGAVGVVRDGSDVLDVLGLMAATRRSAPDRRPTPTGRDAVVLEALGRAPTPPEQVVLRTGLSLGDVGLALDHLEDDGWVAARGGWYERVGRRDA